MTTRELATTAGSRLQSMRAPLVEAGLVGAATTYVGLVDPNGSGHYPTCPFLALTGLFCPGCGSLRAVHALTRGDLDAALGFNVLTVLAVVALGVVWGRGALDRWRGTHRSTVAPAWTLYLLAGTVLVYGVVRNLAVGQALAP